MKGKIYTIGAFLIVMLLTLNGCTASFSTSNGKSPTATTNSNSTAGKNPSAPTAPTEKLKNVKKPENKKGKVAKDVEIPKDWITVYDEKKGYSFSIPDGSTGGHETQEGMDVFIAGTPAPSEVTVVVLAFKDKTMTKEDLLAVAVKFLEGLGATKAEPGKLSAESEDYSLTEAISTLADGSKSKCKILVGTDVTDNYVMIVGTEEPKFASNEKVIDEIWGSFAMWSGGASGNN